MANVLLIDDDPMVRDVLGDMLATAGYRVAAADGVTAMDEFESTPFDIVIADIFMPGEDGITTIRRIRDQDPFVGIVAITGGAKSGNYDVLRISVELGADLGLTKPISRARLLATVAEAEGRRQLRCA
jgi:CheY-like chemotaxis protein